MLIDRNNSGSSTDAVTLTEQDKLYLDEYESHEEIEERELLADYLNALAKFIAVASRDGSYNINKLLEMNGVATDLRNNDISLEEAHEWVENLDVSK